MPTSARHHEEAGAGKRAGNVEKPRILIADDEQSMREWMRLLFQRDGFEVFTAEDGIAARDMIAREYVDVVLTDIRMPRLDGVALLASIRRSAPDVIVTMMTAHWTQDSAEWAEAKTTALKRSSKSRSGTSIS